MTNPFDSSDTIAELARKLEEDFAKVAYHHERVQRVVGNRPEASLSNEPHVREGQLAYGVEDVLQVNIIADGTNTIVQIVNQDDKSLVGEGKARRRKGDRRDQEIGTALAAARAFQDAARFYAAEAKELMR